MTDKLNESLSALMDNEADDLELRRILKALDDLHADNEELAKLKGKWQRYHVLSASLKQEIHSSVSCNILPGIREAIDNEPAPAANPIVHSRTGRKFFQPVLKTLGQGAVAASMALAVLFTAETAMVADSAQGGADSIDIAGGASGQFPGLTGELNPDTLTRVAVQTSMDEEELNRLRRVVSEELEDTPEDRAIPATFNPEGAKSRQD